jgi:formate dehydrogenase
MQATTDQVAAAAATSLIRTPIRPRRISRPISVTRLRAAQGLPCRHAHARGPDQDRERRRLRAGGAGFPTGRKWSLVRVEPAPRLFAVNCDEGEPGTQGSPPFECDPHRFIEGMLIAAWVEAPDSSLCPRRISEVRLLLAQEISRPSVRAFAAHADPSAPRCRCLHLRRRVRDDQRSRVSAPATASAALWRRWGLLAVRRLSRMSRRCSGCDIVAGRRLVHVAGPARAQGFRSFSVSGRVNKPGVAGACRRHSARADR